MIKCDLIRVIHGKEVPKNNIGRLRQLWKFCKKYQENLLRLWENDKQ